MEESEFYIDEDGDKFWYLPSEGKDYWHCLDGPAIEHADGTKSWYVNDQCHRLDGPAIELANGTKAWYVNGQKLDTEKVEAWLEENNADLKTKEGQMAFKLRFG